MERGIKIMIILNGEDMEIKKNKILKEISFHDVLLVTEEKIDII